jgi:hypothetical protein
MQRRYSKPHSFKERLLEVLSDTKVKADKSAPGSKQDVWLEKIRQLETAIDLNDYLSSSSIKVKGPRRARLRDLP